MEREQGPNSAPVLFLLHNRLKRIRVGQKQKKRKENEQRKQSRQGRSDEQWQDRLRARQVSQEWRYRQ